MAIRYMFVAPDVSNVVLPRPLNKVITDPVTVGCTEVDCYSTYDPVTYCLTCIGSSRYRKAVSNHLTPLQILYVTMDTTTSFNLCNIHDLQSDGAVLDASAHALRTIPEHWIPND